MLIAGADIETTGIKTGDHRIVEVYVGLWDRAGERLVDSYKQRIHPQRSIAADAQRVHGISISDLEGCPFWEDVAGDVRRILDRADLIVGHNWKGFDGPFIDYELDRVRLPAVGKPVLDTMLDARWATHNGKVPNLGELCHACNVPYDTTRAHAADYDCDVMMKSFFNALRWGFFHINDEVK